jgi:hypothetical protein
LQTWVCRYSYRIAGNRNCVPFYNTYFREPAYLAAHDMHIVRSQYGSLNQTFIIDGSGIYITRNALSYAHGRFLLAGNTAYRNGIHGIGARLPGCSRDVTGDALQ